MSIKRTLWRCRRGSRELDTVLRSFVSDQYQSLDHASVEMLNLLLQQQDPSLAAWLCHNQKPPARFDDIVNMIKKHQRRTLV